MMWTKCLGELVGRVAATKRDEKAPDDVDQMLGRIGGKVDCERMDSVLWGRRA